MGCRHARTLSFKDYEFVDGELDPERYDVYCSTCWGLEGVEAGEFAPDTSDISDGESMP